MPYFYSLPLDLCEKRIVVLFAKRAAIFVKRAAIFTGKVPQFKSCGTLQDGALSGIAAHTKGKARHMIAVLAVLISAAAACLLHSF